MHPRELIDTGRYPIDDLADPRTQELIAAQRARLRDTGVAVLPGFVRPDAIAAIAAEATRLEAQGHHSEVEGTPYLALPDETFPAGHPRRHLVRSALTAIAYDRFPPSSPLRALYEWDGLLAFVGEVLERRPLYRYADPLGALNVAVMREGDELGWHFDQTDFVVSIGVQDAEVGGDFVAARRLRSPADERYGEVAEVLSGNGEGQLEVIDITPGALMLFEGRHSLHRVTPIEGPTPRHVALLAYDTEDDTCSSQLLRLVRYGREG